MINSKDEKKNWKTESNLEIVLNEWSSNEILKSGSVA